MPFAIRLPSPASVAAVALAGAVVLRLTSYLARRSMSDSAAGRRVLLVVSGKNPEENQSFLSAVAAGNLSLSLFPASDSGDGGADSSDIVVVPDSECSSVTNTFRNDQYLSAIDTRIFGCVLLHSPRLSSTHDLVSLNFKNLPVGTVCVADVQYKGRGRSKNSWESPPGCLMFSFTLQMEDGRKLPLLQYVVCLAISEAITKLCQDKGLPQLDIKIKWPNDVYLKGLKVGGILCTSTYRSKIFDVCIGVGLNVDNEKPTTCLNAEINRVDQPVQKLTREDILASFFNIFEPLFETFLNQGFQAIEERYCKAWLHSGQKVTIEEAHEGEPTEIAVTIQGLTPSGYLLAIDDDNNSYELHPDGNSLDFFKGLVRRKLQ